MKTKLGRPPSTACPCQRCPTHGAGYEVWVRAPTGPRLAGIFPSLRLAARFAREMHGRTGWDATAGPTARKPMAQRRREIRELFDLVRRMRRRSIRPRGRHSGERDPRFVSRATFD